MIEEPPLPAVFVGFRDLVRIHLKQMMKLDGKPPMHAVALLVMVAYEALSALHSQGAPEDYFANHLHRRRNLRQAVGRLLYKSLRDGLAHRYSPNPIIVDRLGEVNLVLLWKQGNHHLEPATQDFVGEGGHLHLRAFRPGEPPVIAVDVDTLRADLDDLFAEVEDRLTSDLGARERFAQSARRLRDDSAETAIGMSSEAWRELFVGRQSAEG